MSVEIRSVAMTLLVSLSVAYTLVDVLVPEGSLYSKATVAGLSAWLSSLYFHPRIRESLQSGRLNRVSNKSGNPRDLGVKG